MSVIYFSAEELGNVAAVLAGNRWSGYGRQQFAAITGQLARVSGANTAAHRISYGERSEAPEGGLTAEQIASAAPLGGNKRRAASTLGLLSYNCVSNGGKDYVAEDSLVALALVGLLSSHARLAS